MHFAAKKVYKPSLAKIASRDAKPSLDRTKPTRDALTNVVSIDLGELGEKVVLMTGDPATCASCAAIFNSYSKTSVGDSGETIWQCEFCDQKNSLRLEDEEIPKADTCDYMTEPLSNEAASANQGSKCIVFCIDISGSMCVTTELSGKHNLMGDKSQNLASLNTEGGLQRLPRESRNVTYISRLQCVQAAINSQLETLQKQYPNYCVSLVCFNNEVTIIGDGTTAPIVVTGDKLYDYDALLEVGSQYIIKNNISVSKDALSKKLYELSETGSTALGPAVTVAIGMVKGLPGSKIVVATDGLANTGVGAMDSHDAAQFYEQLAQFAKLKAITVSVIGIRGENINLALLGKLADATQGDVDLVDPLKIRENFASILQSKLVATEVTVKLFLHKGFEFPKDDEWICPEIEDTKNAGTTAATAKPSGAISAPKKKRQLYSLRHIGNAYEETEITAEFRPSTDDVVLSEIFGEKKEDKEPEMEKVKEKGKEKADEKVSENSSTKTQLPFQVQITYRNLAGVKCTRVVTKTKDVTDDRHEVEKDIDVNVMGIHANWVAAKCAQKGDLEAAIRNNNDYASILTDNAATEDLDNLHAWVSETTTYNDHLQKIQSRTPQPQPQPQPSLFGSVSSLASTVGSTISNAFSSADSAPKNYKTEVEDDETQNMIFARRNHQKNKAQWSSKRKY